ncbi:DUF2780 domain-containing protein [Nitrosomonas sp. JL21]|uniref:DUF2780 domain-containing protein n=1 Tax=Nitrosomonas sp. JL21 TaxID=153949 RepID=UPI00136FD811|nr:DUF2780 domain-containing protein [Nitrosomonas sp. JL21]MBL8496547.1 DUF2780 domain-containing protein [Nitrosomonas sp.]MXS76866.1 DUF2780 domain-containing protein [Nitrosomonas sp. JL21]
MKKESFQQFGSLMILIGLAGCAGTGGTNNPVDTANQGLSSGSVAQGGQQLLSAGTGASAASAVAGSSGVSQIGLVDILVHRLGVSPQQALGGAGAIFQLAQGKMNPQAFTSMSQSIPGMSTMLAAAPASSGANLTSMAGGAGGTLGGAAALASSFKQLDLSPDMVGKFIPVVTNYVRQSSGKASADMLQSVLTSR